jgi:CRP-like cAMP-binding protein
MLADFTSHDIEHAQRLAASRQRWRPGSVLMPAGAVGAHLLVSGWACSQRILGDGRRQIFDVILPGEGYGWDAPGGAVARPTVVALTPVETVEAGGLASVTEGGEPDGLRRALQAIQREEDVRRLEHIVRLGRLTAPERVAHFILEMRQRLGAGGAHNFPLPLTQEVIADLLGLSVVHLNRVLRQFRTEGVVELRRGVAFLQDERALAMTAVLAPRPAERPAFR